MTATVNTISSIGWILRQAKTFDLKLTKLLPEWISFLPVYDDLEEMQIVYSNLCELLESSPKAAIGSKNEYLDNLVSVYKEIMAQKDADIDIKDRLTKVMAQINVEHCSGRIELEVFHKEDGI
jgi:importin-5